MNQEFKFKGKDYISKLQREINEKKKTPCGLSPFRAQSIVFEILKNHLLINKPKDLGFPFDEIYDVDDKKTKIFLDMSNNWKASQPQQRPAVFVYRGDAEHGVGPNVIGNVIGSRVAESEEDMITKVSMPIMINCIHSPIGAVETFAEYIKYPFLYFYKQIQAEYCFHKFRLVSVTAPEQINVDAKDAFSVKLTIATEFNDAWTVKGDHLKLKTVQTSIFTDDSYKALENQ